MKKMIFNLPIFSILTLLFTANCAGTKPSPYIEEDLPDYIPARHLVFIGLDGWGGAYVEKANMPTAKRMMADGSSSIYAQCVMPSKSWPNWTALFYGTPLEEQTSGSGPFPSIFTLVKQRNEEEKPVLFYEWGDLERIAPDEILETRRIRSDSESARKIAAYIKETKPFLTTVVFNEPDHNGFWGFPSYYAKLAEMDGYIAIIEQAVKDAGIYDDTVFILSADHGGTVTGHGRNIPKHRRIPLVIYGSNIKNGIIIPANRSICDIAPTMAIILGLEIPFEWSGKPILGIFK